MRTQLTIAFLLGVVVALSIAFAIVTVGGLPKAHAQTAGMAADMFAVTGTGFQGQSRDVLFVIDSTGKRLAIYDYKNGRLELIAVRNMKYELQMEEWPGKLNPQKPGVREMRDAVEAAERERKPK